MGIVKGLGSKNLVDYVLNNSTLKKDQFTFAMKGRDGLASFLVAKDNVLLSLGQFSYKRFIRVEYGTSEADLMAISKFFDLCIQKLSIPGIEVPKLDDNDAFWSEYYQE